MDEKLHDLFEQYHELLLRAANSIDSEDKYHIDAAFRKKVDKIIKQTAKGLRRYVNSTIPDVNIDESKSVEILRKYGAIHDAANVRLTTYVQIVSSLTESADLIKDSVSLFLKNREDNGEETTIMDLKKYIIDTLKESNGPVMKYSNGRKVRVEAYADMLARTAKVESQNVSMLRSALDNGKDLVECSVVASTCDLCASLQGRIYSISGENPKYPPLYGTAFKNGYSIIHPNCRHQFFPYDPKFHTGKEIAALERKTRQPWNIQGQSDRNREIYLRGQQQKRQWNAELVEYRKMKESLGANMPYKTLGAFRRAVRRKELPIPLLEYRKYGADQLLFEAIQRTEGIRSLPKTVSEYQKLKYDKKKRVKYDSLRREYEMMRVISKKEWDSEYKERLRAMYYALTGGGVIINKVGLLKYLLDNSDSESVINANSKPANYISKDGKSIRFYNKIALFYLTNSNKILNASSKTYPNNKWRALKK